MEYDSGRIAICPSRTFNRLYRVCSIICYVQVLNEILLLCRDEGEDGGWSKPSVYVSFLLFPSKAPVKDRIAHRALNDTRKKGAKEMQKEKRRLTFSEKVEHDPESFFFCIDFKDSPP